MSGYIDFKRDELPETLEEGRLAVVDGALYVGDDSNEPAPVNPTTSASFTPIFTVDGGTVTATGQLTVVKIGRLCTITGGFLISGTTGSPFDPFSIGTIPVGFRPATSATGLYVNGGAFASGSLAYPVEIDTNGNVGVSVDFSTLPNTGSPITVIAQYLTS
jgi:hypothetical protein